MDNNDPHFRYKTLLAAKKDAPEALVEMTRSIWAISLEIPDRIHLDMCNKWEAVLEYIEQTKGH